MSVLLIGANSDTFTNGFRIRRKKQINRNRVRQLKQQEYRKDLDGQVRQKIIRKSKQKEIENEIRLGLEYVYQKQIKNRQIQQLAKHYHLREDQEKHQIDQFSPDRTKEKTEKKYPFPVVNNYETTYIKSYQSPDPTEKKKIVNFSSQQNRSTSKRVKTPASFNQSRRIKTQNFNYSTVDPERQDPEVYLQKLRQYEDRKINEVYQMLLDSVDIFNKKSNIQDPFLKENKNCNHRRYKSFSLKPNNEETNNIFYALPHKGQSIKQSDFSTTQQERQWRAWYAKQKLKELQSYVKKEQLDRELEDRMFKSNQVHITPRFTPQE